MWPDDDTKAEKLSQVINIVANNSMMMNGCRSFGTKQTKYFPEKVQREVMPNELLRSCEGRHAHGPTVGPRMGIAQSSRACVGKDVIVAQSMKVSHFYLDKDLSSRPIPVLDPGKKTIAGIWIPNLDECVPERSREEIKEALEKLTFHVRYQINTENEERRKFMCTHTLLMRVSSYLILPCRSCCQARSTASFTYIRQTFNCMGCRRSKAIFI